jgi:hypothetical protein
MTLTATATATPGKRACECARNATADLQDALIYARRWAQLGRDATGLRPDEVSLLGQLAGWAAAHASALVAPVVVRVAVDLAPAVPLPSALAEAADSEAFHRLFEPLPVVAADVLVLG